MSPESLDAAAPPVAQSWNDRPRRVGVEIEYAAVSAREGALLVSELFGGTVQEEDSHRFEITGTELGDFTCELDSQYAHRSKESDTSSDGEETFISRFQSEMRKIYGDVGAAVLPCEIVCPPVSYTLLPRLDRLVDALRKAGAAGTRSNPLYAFGAQLNPEIATRDSEWLLSVFKAYLLASPWLRAVMDIDVTRRVMAFADPFPASYAAKVVGNDYWPGIDDFISDYLEANPTRNRELDLLPLFAWIDDGLVRSQVHDARIKPRPTFHYRLPDANLDDPHWSITTEWRRWLAVERLASDREQLGRVAHAFQSHSADGLRSRWPLAFSELLLVK